MSAVAAFVCAAGEARAAGLGHPVRERRQADRRATQDRSRQPDRPGAALARWGARHHDERSHGTPPKVLSTMLGHASVVITLDRYGHLYPGDVHLYVDRLGEVALAACADYLRTGGHLTPPTATGEGEENSL